MGAAKDDVEGRAIAMALWIRARRACVSARWRRGLAAAGWAVGAVGNRVGFFAGVLTSSTAFALLLHWGAASDEPLRAGFAAWLAGSAALGLGLAGWILLSEGGLWKRPDVAARRGLDRALGWAIKGFNPSDAEGWINEASASWASLARGWTRALAAPPWVMVLGVGLAPWLALFATGALIKKAAGGVGGAASAREGLARAWRRWAREMTSEGRASEEFAKAQRDRLGKLAKAPKKTASPAKGRL